ncbi:MAG: glycosyltransferase family 61 protein [Acidimicrobiia bacterium]|nr:glycosyltransferase family 61 protein [Acidimicrobiia bacterium]MDH5519903.1 glycosyltransferase family 61 protein [Acidimicrobiia bacterium]
MTESGATTTVAAEAHPALRSTFRFHQYRRLTGYVTPDLLLRGWREPDSGTVGWMTARDAVVLIEPGADGTLFLDRSTVLAESCLHRRPGLSRPGVQSATHVHPHTDDVVELDTEVALVFRPSWYNYFHWITQCLPMALHALDVQPDAEIILPTYASFDARFVQPSFSEQTYRQSLDVVLGPDQPTRFLEPGYYRFRTVHLPLFPQPSIFGHSFRSRFFDRFEPILGPIGDRRRRSGAPRGSRRLFIPRGGATNRGRVDEEVHAVLARLAAQAGYEMLDPSTVSWHDQLAAFAEASHVLGIHGAGLTNIVFSTDATVIEYNALIRDENKLRDPYFCLCCDLGHRYYLIRDVDLGQVEADLLASME